MDYDINDFDIKSFRVRQLSYFIKHVIKLRDKGKLSAFCDLYDIDESDIKGLLKFVDKFSNESLITKIKYDDSFWGKISKVYFENNEKEAELQF